MLGEIFADIENLILELKYLEKLARLKRIPENTRERIFYLIGNDFKQSFSCVDTSTSVAGNLVFRFEIVGELKNLIATLRARNLDFD